MQSEKLFIRNMHVLLSFKAGDYHSFQLRLEINHLIIKMQLYDQ